MYSLKINTMTELISPAVFLYKILHLLNLHHVGLTALPFDVLYASKVLFCKQVALDKTDLGC